MSASVHTLGATAHEPLVVTHRRPMRLLVVPDPLRLIDGRLHLRLGDGLACPLLHGDPTGLHQGWSAPTLYVGCDQLLWLSLQHEEGHLADWFLDDGGRILANSMEALAEPFRGSLLRHVRELESMKPGPSRDEALAAYRQMHPQARAAVTAMLAAEDRRMAGPRMTLSPAPLTTTPDACQLRRVTGLTGADLKRTADLDGSWHLDGNGLHLLAGRPLSFTLTLPYRPTHARVSLELRGTALTHLLTVAVDGWTVGTTRVGPEKIAGSRLDYWLPPEALEHDRISVSLLAPMEQTGAVTALNLGSVSLDLGVPMPEVAHSPDPATLLARFESLGENCEFGFVQRYFGIEPLGMFRFAGALHMRNMLSLLETDLAGLGDPGSLRAALSDTIVDRSTIPPGVMTEFRMGDPARNFWYHSFRGPQHETEAEALALNEQKLRYLRRKFIEDLEDGEKIWVLKDSTRGDINEAFAFLEVLSRKSPNRLLWVTRQVEGRPSGAVEWIAPNLLRGYSDGAHTDPLIFDPGFWLRLCRNAERAFAERDARRATDTSTGTGTGTISA